MHSIRSHGIEIIVRKVDHVRSAAFYRVCKAGVILTGTRGRHWLILSLQDIKKNASWPGGGWQDTGIHRIIY
jgi:hypothetical protein